MCNWFSIVVIVALTAAVVYALMRVSEEKKKAKAAAKLLVAGARTPHSTPSSSSIPELTPIPRSLLWRRLPPGDRQQEMVLNPTNRPVTVGKQDLTPGLAGQGYSILT